MISEAVYLDVQKRFYEAYVGQMSQAPSKSLDQYRLPQPDLKGGQWMIFHCHAADYVRALHEALQQFDTSTKQLAAWDQVLGTDGSERIKIFDFCIRPLALSCLLSPFSLHERIAYCTAHLLHLSEHHADPKASRFFKEKLTNAATLGTSRWNGLATRLGIDLGVLSASLSTIDPALRHIFTHRLPPNLEHGFVTQLARVQEGELISFGFGGEPPLTMSALLMTLSAERSAVFQSFDAFYSVVLAMIAVWQNRLSSTAGHE